MICKSCDFENLESFKFCKKCGTKLNDVQTKDYSHSIKKTNIAFFTLLAFVTLINVIEIESDYKYSLLIDVVFAMIVLFLYFSRDKVENIVLFKGKISLLLLVQLLCLMIIMAFGVHYLANYLNSFVLTREVSYYSIYISSPFPLAICIVSVAVFPAIFEELAFRGLIFNYLKNITTTPASLIISSLLFTVLHFSIISFIWIFPLGLLFGYLRIKYNHILYGIICHFVYNTMVVLIEYWFYVPFF